VTKVIHNENENAAPISGVCAGVGDDDDDENSSCRRLSCSLGLSKIRSNCLPDNLPCFDLEVDGDIDIVQHYVYFAP
jgi:hypothetical protein